MLITLGGWYARESTCGRVVEFCHPTLGATVALYDNYYRYTWSFGSQLSSLRHLEERNPDGSGNNLTHSDWGAAHTHFLRVTENSYLDGVGTLWDLPLPNLGSQGIPPTPPIRSARCRGRATSPI